MFRESFLEINDTLRENASFNTYISYLTQNANIPSSKAQGCLGMGQAQTSSFVSPFAAPPLMLNTDDLVRNWMTDGNNDTRYHYQGQSRSERHRCRSDGAKASSTSPPVDNGVTGVMVQCGPQIESQKHKLLSTSPAFIFMMIRHQNGEEVILSREAVHGATSRLTYSRHQKDIVLVLSDHPAVHLPARAIATKAGMGEMLFVREGRSRARDRSTEKRICKPMHSMTLLARPGGRSHDFLCGFQNIIATVLSSVQLQAVLPRVASDWEAHLALVLVNVACWHRDLPGLTLLFLGMLLVAEAFRWHTIEIVLGEGGRDRQLLRAVPWDWEVNIGRCLMRWRRVSCASPRISKARPAITTRSVMKEEEMAVFGETQVILEEMIDLEETVEQVAMSEEELAVTVIPSGNSVALSEVSAQETDRSIYGSQRQASDTVIAAEHRPRSTDATAATVHEVEEAEVSACPFACPLEYSEKNPSSSEIAAPRRRSIENISITSTGVRRPPLPLRYLTVTGNNVAKAQAKWAATLRWRAAYGADTILEAPHTNYGLIKKQFPQFVAGRSRSGNPVVRRGTQALYTIKLSHSPLLFTQFSP